MAGSSPVTPTREELLGWASEAQALIDNEEFDPSDIRKANATVAALRSLAQQPISFPHDGPCFYCGEHTSSIAGNPGKWPLVFCQPDGTGIVKYHHTSCVVDRLPGFAQQPGHIEHTTDGDRS